MSKTPLFLQAIVASVLVVSAGSAIADPGPLAEARPPAQVIEPGFNAFDGRRVEGAEAMSLSAVAEGSSEVKLAAGGPWDLGGASATAAEHGGLDGSTRPSLELGGFDPVAAAAQSPATFDGGDTAAAPSRDRSGAGWFADLFRYGGLPEPASWALILIGFAMIGGAFRGFVVANRRLARLQPDDLET